MIMHKVRFRHCSLCGGSGEWFKEVEIGYHTISIQDSTKGIEWFSFENDGTLSVTLHPNFVLVEEFGDIWIVEQKDETRS